MGPVELVTRTETVEGVVVVTVDGDVDLASSPELRRVLTEALATSPTIQVDLSGLTFIDSSGLSALVEAHRTARDAGGVAVLRNPPAVLRRLLEITSLDGLLVVETSETSETPGRTDEA